MFAMRAPRSPNRTATASPVAAEGRSRGRMVDDLSRTTVFPRRCGEREAREHSLEIVVVVVINICY
jgi:hypothetical protein